MSNLTDNDLIERYLLGKLTREEIRRVEIRLDDDREFARKLRLLTTFPEMMSEPARLEYEKQKAEAEVPVVKKKSFLLRKPKYLIWSGVLLFILIGIALVFFFIKQGHHREKVVLEENVTKKENIVNPVVPPPKDSVAVTTPVTQPEKKETREITSGSGQNAIELLNPANGMKFSRKEMILFNWAQRTDSFTRLYIFSEYNDQVIFWRGIRLGIREYKVPGSYLFPGKYYWYVGTKKEMHKFIITE
jgi:hypothetical protein